MRKYGERGCEEYNLMIARHEGSMCTQWLVLIGMKNEKHIECVVFLRKPMGQEIGDRF